MNKSAVKNFAVYARTALISAVTQRAFEYEVTENGKNNPAQLTVNGKALTQTEINQRNKLINRINLNGFNQTVEEVAYTWFNRFIALRFMEVNGYLPSRIRVFSDQNNDFKPEILKEAMYIDIEGIDRQYVLELLDKQQIDTLYKYLLIRQCNALNHGLPYMFEKIDSWTELLFPNNLLRKDSIIARMVSDIPEEDWKNQVQIIGWLYQYYNSEPKDKVFADLKKNIKINSVSIPFATQLFTPDWIVRYMVENSLGRLWADGHGIPENADWKYYLPEAEQSENVRSQIEKIRGEYNNIRPEDIKFIDTCMGSGHILVYAFDLLVEIYTSCGWSARDAVKSILQNNLYGLDIDRRAYQLAYFSVMMKARQYSRRILDLDIQPNLANFADVMGVDTGLLSGRLEIFAGQFSEADTLGSLMTVTAPEGLAEEVSDFSGSFGINSVQLEMMIKIYNILGQKYDVVCTNPPYMSSKGMDKTLSDFVKKNFPDSKADLFACFIEKCGQLKKNNGYCAMITQHAFMFLSTYENLRKKLLNKTTVNMVHLGARAFDEIGGEVVQTTAFVQTGHISDYMATYSRLVDIVGENEKRDAFLRGENLYTAKQENFSKIPCSPVAYWVSENFIKAFENEMLYKYSISPSQNITGNNNKYVRKHWELFKSKVNDKNQWIFYAKGGGYRKWWGNLYDVVNWTPQARNIYQYGDGKHASQIINQNYWYKKGITWGLITSSLPSFRVMPDGATFDKGGSTVIVDDNVYYFTLGLLNSKIYLKIALILNPTLNFQVKDIRSSPLILKCTDKINKLVQENIQISKQDWDSYETSWDFEMHPLI